MLCCATETTLAMPCIEKEDSRGEPEAVANSIDASEEESDAANTGACGKVKRQHMDHIAEKGNVGSFHCGLVHKPVSIHEALKMKPKPPWMNDGMKNKSSVGCQEIETKVRSHPSDEEGWENSSLREFDGPLSLEERRTCKTPQEIQGASCAPGGERQRRRRIQSNIHRVWCFSVSDGSGKVLGHHLKASWYGWRNK